MSTVPPDPLGRHRFYYGWRIVAIAALAMVGTLPGRTQGLGLITEPLLADLGLDRVTYAGVNFWATIIGALGAVGVGRLMDRFGTRVVLTTVAATLGAIVCFMSQVTTLTALAIAMTLTRGVGQSALSVVSITMVGHWFVRRINTAMAVYSLALSVGFMVAFPVVGSLVQSWGWRAAWLVIGVALVAALAPLSWLVARSGPEAIGVRSDGEGTTVAAAQDVTAATDLAGYRWTKAVGTGAFWVFALGTALYGLVASGIGLFNESILAERGFGPTVYYQTLVVTAMTALAGNFLGGWLVARVSLTRLMAVSLFALAGGLVVLPHVASLGAVMAWATAMGLSGGLVMVLFFSVWPKVFGRRHLGRIQGAAQTLTVLASALGPLLLAWCVELTGSYAAMFRILAGVIAATAATALVVDIPPPSLPHVRTPQRAV
jgi:MFS family permease